MDVETLTPDAEETSMRELGIETDAAQGREPVEAAETPRPQAPEETPEPPPPPTPERDGTEPESPEPEQVAAEKLGRDIKTGQFKKAERPETDYSRAQKEQARKDRSWQALQAEKEQFRMAQSQWEEQQRMAQLEAARQQYQPLKKEGLTAQEYYQGAQRFEQEGDHENALKAYKVASELGRAEQGRYQQMQEVNTEYAWRKQMEELGTQYPQIFQEPIVGHLQRIIEQNPDFYRMRNGFRLAAEGAHLLAQNQLLKEKDDEIIALKAELEKHQRKGQPARGGHASPRMGEKDFDDMDLNEQEAELRRMTAEADNYR
jgi:hypothetical protein